MNVTQYRLAKTISLGTRQIHSFNHGERSIAVETASLFSRYFGNSAGFWMGLQSQYDLETGEFQLPGKLSAVVALSSTSGAG